uniref:Uncharacterized protein n=1 Tax=Amphiprion percula TaxID=161767 RepID=A0A3P8S6I9_AMPPE
MSLQVRLSLLPSVRCLYDEPVQVKVAGLRSQQLVTMRGRLTDDKGVMFSSSATYMADGSGKIELDRDPSLGGSYVGVEPMGLFWSMKPDTLHTKLTKTNLLNPQTVTLSVHDKDDDRMLAEVTNERFLIGDGVKRVPIKEGNIRGVLFMPPGGGPFPAVLDLSSSRSENRACLLANKGFVVLSITLYQNNFAKVKEMHLDYFEEAIDFLKHSKVGSKRIGVISRSIGGAIALSIAGFVPGVEAVVCINGCNANVAFPLYYKKHLILSPLSFDFKMLFPTESGAVIATHVLDNPLAEENNDTLIPIEQAKGHFLFVASEDDLTWDSKAYMDQMVERLKRHAKDNFESVSYPGAGHLLQPPYEPHCRSCASYITTKPVMWGGEARAHAAAEVHLWKKIQEFFRTHLSCETAQ